MTNAENGKNVLQFFSQTKFKQCTRHVVCLKSGRNVDWGVQATNQSDLIYTNNTQQAVRHTYICFWLANKCNRWICFLYLPLFPPLLLYACLMVLWISLNPFHLCIHKCDHRYCAHRGGWITNMHNTNEQWRKIWKEKIAIVDIGFDISYEYIGSLRGVAPTHFSTYKTSHQVTNTIVCYLIRMEFLVTTLFESKTYNISINDFDLHS